MMDAAFPSWMLSGAALLGAYMLAVSALTVLVYAKDKSAAERGMWRVRESTLHLWSLLGGWPGAYVAQHALRHKTRKDAFLTRYRLTVAANCGVVALVFVLLAWSFGGSGGTWWPLVAVAVGHRLGESGAGWLEATAGVLLGAVSMTVLRAPRLGHCVLALLAGGAVVVVMSAGVDGAAALLGRAVSTAGRHPAGLAALVAGQCAAALLGAGTARRM